MSGQKDIQIKTLTDEFKYIIDTNEKYNHELLDEVAWLKRTNNRLNRTI